MITHTVAIKDRALDAFLPPWNVPSLGAAIRAFQDEINNPQGQMFKHPDDYDLYEVAQWDDHTGKFTPQEPTRIAIGKQLRQPEN